MFSWLFGIYGRLFRQSDHESGPDLSKSGIAGQPLAANVVPVVSSTETAPRPAVFTAEFLPFVRPVAARKPRSTFMLAARISSVNKLNVPSVRAPAPLSRLSSTKPTPSAKVAKPAAGGAKKSVKPSQPKKIAGRSADIIRLAPQSTAQSTRLRAAA